MASKALKIKSTTDLSDVIRHLENLIDSLKEGTVTIRKDDKAVTLTPQEPISMEIEAEAKSDKKSRREKLQFELKWKKGETVQEKAFSISPVIAEQPDSADLEEKSH